MFKPGASSRLYTSFAVAYLLTFTTQDCIGTASEYGALLPATSTCSLAPDRAGWGAHAAFTAPRSIRSENLHAELLFGEQASANTTLLRAAPVTWAQTRNVSLPQHTCPLLKADPPAQVQCFPL